MKYMIYRMHDDGSPSYYGWTDDKTMMMAFFDQRSSDKYLVRKVKDVPRGILSDSMFRLKVLMLPTQQSDERVPLICNDVEMNHTINAINEMFTAYMDDECWLSRVIWWNLEREYVEALRIIGYNRDFEYEAYPEQEDDPDGLKYLEMYQSLNAKSKYFKDTAYTLEAFIRVMEQDM